MAKNQGGKGGRKGSNTVRKARRKQSWERCHVAMKGGPSKKDRRVFKSSHGKFKTVAELEAHRVKAVKGGGKRRKRNED